MLVILPFIVAILFIIVTRRFWILLILSGLVLYSWQWLTGQLPS